MVSSLGNTDCIHGDGIHGDGIHGDGILMLFTLMMIPVLNRTEELATVFTLMRSQLEVDHVPMTAKPPDKLAAELAPVPSVSVSDDVHIPVAAEVAPLPMCSFWIKWFSRLCYYAVLMP